MPWEWSSDEKQLFLNKFHCINMHLYFVKNFNTTMQGPYITYRKGTMLLKISVAETR